MKIQISKRPNLLQLFLNWLRGNAQTVNFGEFIHFKGKDAKSNNIEPGSLLIGWHYNEDEKKHVHGTAYVEKVDGSYAIVKLIKYTEY